MKTKEELTALKEEVETLNKKLAELSEDELKLVVGGTYHINNETGLLVEGKLVGGPYEFWVASLNE